MKPSTFKPFPTALKSGFALVVTLSLMILLTIIAVGLLGLASIELRKSSQMEARNAAMGNARLGLMLALGRLQDQLGDDRRITADAAIYHPETKNPAAVGVWSGWSPDLGSKITSQATGVVDYDAPKKQQGFRGWLVSAADPNSTANLDWHKTAPSGTPARLFFEASSGFNLDGGKIPVKVSQKSGTVAWAITQENTKARINIGTDDSKRINPEDRLQAPSRPNLALSSVIQQPTSDWQRRPATICSFSQAALDSAYGVPTSLAAAKIAKDFTVNSYSLLTDPVKGGLKVDLTTGFSMNDDKFKQDTWSDPAGQVNNPFRSTTPQQYQGQKPLFTPVVNNAQAQILMDFAPASVNHKFQVNGVPTFDTLRAYYRSFLHLYTKSGDVTAFERPYAHIATPDKVIGRPYGEKSQPQLAPVLDRLNFLISIYAKPQGNFCILLTPFVTIWNPHNVSVECEGLVIYPWIDFAVIWNLKVTAKDGTSVQPWQLTLARLLGEGYGGHGRSTRPYFYLHLTQNGISVSQNLGQTPISPAIRLAPGEVRLFALADKSPKDLDFNANSKNRTWRMKPVANASDITSSLTGGISLNSSKTTDGLNPFNYQLKPGDIVESNKVEFDRSKYFYIVNMADAWHIKNSSSELMVEARPAGSSLPALPATPNLHFYNQIQAGQAFGKGDDSFIYPSYKFEEINDSPKLVGSLLTYHRVAQSSSLTLADLMFTTNPRQPFVSPYLSGAQFQTGPHYESLLRGGSSLASLAMETTVDGKKAFYGPSHSASSGRSNLAFFEIPRSPTLSLGSFQHCDISATAFSCASQIANSWASPYLPAASVSKLLKDTSNNVPIKPSGLGVYDYSYLANEALFDGFYLSGAAPHYAAVGAGTGSTTIWETPQIKETKSSADVLTDFFSDPVSHPLRNPRMTPYLEGGDSLDKVKERLSEPAACRRLAAYLMTEGGFNINSTSEVAWTAVLASLRGEKPALSEDKTPQSRFRHILAASPTNMAENDPWSGFRTLSDAELKLLAKNLVKQIRERGPFLSLGEFVNRRVSSKKDGLNLAGAIQVAIDESGLNQKFSYSTFGTSAYPNPENLPNPNTGTNTPGWLTQADILQGLAPFITPRSDTFVIRSIGEATAPDGKVLATVRLEAVVQRTPDWVDPVDDAATGIGELKSKANKDFGRKFRVISIRELMRDSTTGAPI